MARSEYWSCPLRLPTPAAAHVAIASGVSQRVTSPRRTRARSYSAQFPTRYGCLVLRMHSRLHIEIMTRLRSRWSTCRPLLAHRPESAHQRRGALARIHAVAPGGACPVPASSGMTTGRHRLYRGGHRQANAALHRAVVVRMRYHQPTIDSVIRRRADGRTKRDIIRCLTRFLAREIYQRVMRDFRTRQQLSEAS